MLNYLINLILNVLTKLPEALVMYVLVRSIVGKARQGKREVAYLMRRHSKHHSGKFTNCNSCQPILERHLEQQEVQQVVAVDLYQ